MSAVVSVYIPTRNRLPLLIRAIESVLLQTYRSLELIVVNDASTDGTRAYLDALAARDARVVVIHNESVQGGGAARNRALAAAHGEFITGLDDDDEFLEERVDAFVKALITWPEQTTPSCLFTPIILKTGITAPVEGQSKDLVTLEDLFEANYIGSQIFCARSHLIELGGFDVSMPAWQDLELYMRLVSVFGPARMIRPPTYRCHIEPQRARLSRNADDLREAFVIISRKYPKVRARLHRKLFLQLFSPFYRITPRPSDFRYLLGPGFSFALVARMIRQLLWTFLKR